MAIISKLKAILTLDNKQFEKGLNESKQQVSAFGGAVGKLGGLIAGAFAVSSVIQFAKELGELGHTANNVSKAFNTLGISLQSLRNATGGGVSDLRLQQLAVQANNLGLPVKQLASYFEFATKRAAETGESVEYLVNSIVVGIGRKSALVLDNLGISAIDLQEEFKKTGDFAEAANNLIQRESVKSVVEIEDAVSGVNKLTTAWDNLRREVAISEGMFDNIAGEFAEILGLASGGGTRYRGTFLNEKGIEETAQAIAFLNQKFQETGLKYYNNELQKAIKHMATLQKEAKALEALNVSESPYGSIFSSGLSDASSQYAQANMGLSTMVALMSELGLKATIASTSMQGLAATQGSVISQSSATIDQINMLNSALENAATQGIAMAAQAIGTMIGGDTESALENFVQGIAGLLEGFGALLISFGVSLAVLKDSMNPYAMIAAGAALVIIGAAMSASLGGISSAAGGGGSAVTGGYGGGGYSGGSGYDYNREIVLVARGEDLVGVINRQNYMNNTNG